MTQPHSGRGCWKIGEINYAYFGGKEQFDRMLAETRAREGDGPKQHWDIEPGTLSTLRSVRRHAGT